MNAAPPAPENQDGRPPRGALAVVAIGLIACLVAALASTGKGEGEAAHLEWVQSGTAADSKAVPVPGGEGEMRLTATHIRATGTNVSGYSLFTVGSTLRVSAGSPIAGGQVICAVQAFHGTEIAQSSGGLRGTYPRSSEAGIFNQEVPETVLMDFSSHSSELAVLEVLDRPQRFTTEKGIKLEWPEYEVGTEHLDYSIAGQPKRDLELPFFTIWKTKKYAPAAAIECALKTKAGKTSVRTRVALKHPSPPIDEEAEELKAEEKEEQEDEEDQ